MTRAEDSDAASTDLAPVVYCADGSAASTEALRAGRELIGRAHRVVLATVVGEHDPSLVSGSGFAGGVMTADEYDRFEASVVEGGRKVLADVAQELGWELPESDRVLLRGSPGPELCAYAEQIDAVAMVVGSRGHGGIKRAVLGSASDHIVRNAPCTVVVTNADAAE